jgi:hypothetical protein
MFVSPAVLNRRTLLLGAAGAAALIVVDASGAFAATVGTPLDPVAPLPPGAPVRTAFTPAEQRFASYLATLAGITNDIDDGTDAASYGWLAGGWSRTPTGNSNARVQEHVFTLSWFYANQRSWNPYFHDAKLLARLDAAIFHYLRLQHSDGSFPEYDLDEHGLAPTGFGIGYLAKTLINLRAGNCLPAQQQNITTALTRAMGWLLDTGNAIWNAPVTYVNQVMAGLAGCSVALTLTPDAALSARLTERFAYLAAHGQSSAGFWYEPTGMDINYNFEVCLPELADYYRHTGDPVAVSMVGKFATWFGYNLLREPDTSGWLTYVGVSARTTEASYDDVIGDTDRQTLGSTFVAEVPAVAAFYTSAEGKASARATWAAQPGPAPVLAKLDTSPRIIAHATYAETLPSNAQKAAAVAQLPYLAATNWAEVRIDTVVHQHYFYARRPGYYFGGFFGSRASDHVRGGTGFLWTPKAGTVIQAQQSDGGAWATVLTGGATDAASASLSAAYAIGSSSWSGARTAPGGNPVSVVYHPSTGGVTTTLTLYQSALVRSVRASAAATEQTPLILLPTDTVTWSTGARAAYNANSSATATGVTIRRGPATIVFNWTVARAATISTTATTFLADGRRRLHLLRVPHNGSIDLSVTIS